MFFDRPVEEQVDLLGTGLPRVGVEAASPFGWAGLVDRMVAMNSFGASGKAQDLYRYFGITPEAVATQVRELLAR